MGTIIAEVVDNGEKRDGRGRRLMDAALRNKLRELYWKAERSAVGAMTFWEDTRRYLYLPRLRGREVLAQAIVKGAATKDFFATAFGQRDGAFEGFKFDDANVQLDDTLLLIEPDAAKAYEAGAAAKAAAATVATSTHRLRL